MRLQDRTVDLRPGVCIWARPGGLYLADQDPRDRLGVNAVHFDLIDDRTGRRIDDRQLPGEVHELTDAAYGDAVTRRIVELARQSEELAGRARAMRHRVAVALLTGLLMDLDTRVAAGAGRLLTAAQRRHREVIARITTRIATSPHDVPAVETLAAEAGYSVDHFGRVFREVTGQTPQAYIVAARINRARQLLMETSMTVSEVANVLGYRDVYFFSRQFKQKTGRPPSAFRAGGSVT